MITLIIFLLGVLFLVFVSLLWQPREKDKEWVERNGLTMEKAKEKVWRIRLLMVIYGSFKWLMAVALVRFFVWIIWQ